MPIFRRTDLGLRGDAVLKALKQQARDTGAIPAGGAGLWGNITGNIDNQIDLNAVRNDLEALALLESGD